jgi:hypothetical protein
MNPHNYTHLIFDKGAKNIQWKTDSWWDVSCYKHYGKQYKGSLRTKNRPARRFSSANSRYIPKGL